MGTALLMLVERLYLRPELVIRPLAERAVERLVEGETQDPQVAALTMRVAFLPLQVASSPMGARKVCRVAPVMRPTFAPRLPCCLA